jgi:hypothetical protein
MNVLFLSCGELRALLVSFVLGHVMGTSFWPLLVLLASLFFIWAGSVLLGQERKYPISFLSTVFPFCFFASPICSFMMSSSSWLNNLLLCHSVGLIPLNFNSDALLCIFVISGFLTWPNHCNNFFYIPINKFWIPSSYLTIFSSNPIYCCFPSSFLKKFMSIAWILLCYLCKRPCFNVVC